MSTPSQVMLQASVIILACAFTASRTNASSRRSDTLTSSYLGLFAPPVYRRRWPHREQAIVALEGPWQPDLFVAADEEADALTENLSSLRPARHGGSRIYASAGNTRSCNLRRLCHGDSRSVAVPHSAEWLALTMLGISGHE